MAWSAGIASRGLWSISRGLARGLESRSDYVQMMDLADSPRAGDLDGRGNLSQKALQEFVPFPEGLLGSSDILGSETPKGAVSLKFPAEMLEDLFPQLYPRS